MGLLRDSCSGRVVTLGARTLIGRGPSSAVVIADRRASGEHALVTWDGARWEVRDLGSRNGTFVDGSRVPTGERIALDRDSRLGFGTAQGPWILIDAHGPDASARNAAGDTLYATSGVLALPSIESPRAIAFLDDDIWRLELDGAMRAVRDQDSIDLDGVSWTLSLPPRHDPLPGTVKGTSPARGILSLAFTVSPDEEHVAVSAVTREGKKLTLPTRTSHYLLLTLARARLEDAERGAPEEEQGWVYANDLANMLGYTAEHVNVEIFRTRALFARMGIEDASQLIERRSSTRQLRISVGQLAVRRNALR